MDAFFIMPDDHVSECLMPVLYGTAIDTELLYVSG